MILRGKQAFRHCGEQDQDDPGVTFHLATPQFTSFDKPASSFFLFLFRHGHREFRKSLQRPHTRLRLRAKGTAKKSGPARIANFVRRVNAKIVLCQPYLWRRLNLTTTTSKSHRRTRSFALPTYRQKRMLPGANNVVPV